MATPNLTPSWVVREEKEFSVDLFPHVPAIHEHIRNHNLLGPPLVVHEDIIRTDSFTDNSSFQSQASGNLKPEDRELLEKLEENLLFLQESVDCNPMFKKPSEVDDSDSSSQSLPTPESISSQERDKNSDTKDEVILNERKSPRKHPPESPKNRSPRKARSSPLSHNAHLSRLFGVSSGKARFTIGGKKIGTVSDESNLRHRIIVPPRSPRESSIADLSKDYSENRKKFKNSSPTPRSNPVHTVTKSSDTFRSNRKPVHSPPVDDKDCIIEEITQFTPTPKVGQKRSRVNIKDANSPKRKKMKRTHSIKKEPKTPSPPKLSRSPPIESQILLEDSEIQNFTPLSMDLRLMETQVKPTPSPECGTQLTGKLRSIGSEEELEFLRSRSTLTSTGSTSSPKSIRNNNSTLFSATSSSSDEFPQASIDPLLLGSGMPRSYSSRVSDYGNTSITQLQRENQLLKDKLHQLERKTERWSVQVQLLTKLIHRHCPELLRDSLQ